MINQHNKRYLCGEESYYMKVNQFADLLTHEFNEAMNGYRAPNDRLVSLIVRKTSNLNWYLRQLLWSAVKIRLCIECEYSGECRLAQICN